jgi:hypothetical protein
MVHGSGGTSVLSQEKRVEVVEWWRVGVVEGWSGGVVEWWRAGVLEWWSVGVLEYWSTGVSEYWSIGVVAAELKNICNAETSWRPSDWRTLSKGLGEKGSQPSLNAGTESGTK